MCDQTQGEFNRHGEWIPGFSQQRLLLGPAKKPAQGFGLIAHIGGDGGTTPDPGDFHRVLRILSKRMDWFVPLAIRRITIRRDASMN